MATVKRFEDMDVWKKTRTLNNMVYSVTKTRQFKKDWVLVNHLRKTSLSIISNIAEGFERDGNKEFINFLSISKGSCGELRCQLYVALDQCYINEFQFTELSNLATEISKSLKGLIIYLQTSDFKGIKYK